MSGLWDNFPPQIVGRLEQGMGCWSGVGDGWVPLIVELDAKLGEIVPGYTIDQIKEKFGTLRYYISFPTGDVAEEVYALVDEYEKKSSTICEDCGEPGTTRGVRWLRTVCDKHERKRG